MSRCWGYRGSPIGVGRDDAWLPTRPLGSKQHRFRACLQTEYSRDSLKSHCITFSSRGQTPLAEAEASRPYGSRYARSRSAPWLIASGFLTSGWHSVTIQCLPQAVVPATWRIPAEAAQQRPRPRGRVSLWEPGQGITSERRCLPASGSPRQRALREKAPSLRPLECMLSDATDNSGLTLSTHFALPDRVQRRRGGAE
jgi:hypothetical protein